MLKRLNLSANDFHNYSAFAAFEHFLSVNRCLQELHLTNCKIEKKGVYIIGNGLRRNHGLKKLFIANNCFEDAGTNYLLESILDNRELTTLEELDISKNGLQFPDTNFICSLLQDN